MPMLPPKTFATISLKQFFLWDVWFVGQILCFNIRLPCLLLVRFNSTKSISPTKSYLNDAVDLDLNSVLALKLVEIAIWFHLERKNVYDMNKMSNNTEKSLSPIVCDRPSWIVI